MSFNDFVMPASNKISYMIHERHECSTNTMVFAYLTVNWIKDAPNEIKVLANIKIARIFKGAARLISTDGQHGS